MSVNPPWADKKLADKQRADMAFRYQDWLLTKNVPNGSFRLLYAILQHLNEENQFHCFPSIETLAARIKRAPQTVWEMLPKLEKLGVIEIEWGSQGSGHSNTYRLPAAFLEFYFGPEKGRQPKPDPVPRKHRQAGVSKHRQAEVSGAPETQVQPSENSGLTRKKHRPACESHLEPPISHKKERGSAARTSRVVREGASNSTSQDAPIPATDGPVARTAHAPLIDDLASQNQPSRDPKIGTGPNGADADAAFGAVYRRGREVLGAAADAVTAKLLSAYDGDAESALDALAAAEEESDPRQYIEKDIEAARRASRQ
ncbi:hypothetical protein ABIB94_001567 [Bradyrhizobium sp. JR7.2]|uniref:hypothetical protein n=1 Tax=Bradyrhizobium sp. JR7.2 TaxID=3156375 RepID=UPI0033917211